MTFYRISSIWPRGHSPTFPALSQITTLYSQVQLQYRQFLRRAHKDTQENT